MRRNIFKVFLFIFMLLFISKDVYALDAKLTYDKERGMFTFKLSGDEEFEYYYFECNSNDNSFKYTRPIGSSGSITDELNARDEKPGKYFCEVFLDFVNTNGERFTRERIWDQYFDVVEPTKELSGELFDITFNIQGYMEGFECPKHTTAVDKGVCFGQVPKGTKVYFPDNQKNIIGASEGDGALIGWVGALPGHDPECVQGNISQYKTMSISISSTMYACFKEWINGNRWTTKESELGCGKELYITYCVRNIENLETCYYSNDDGTSGSVNRNHLASAPNPSYCASDNSNSSNDSSSSSSNEKVGIKYTRIGSSLGCNKELDITYCEGSGKDKICYYDGGSISAMELGTEPEPNCKEEVEETDKKCDNSKLKRDDITRSHSFEMCFEKDMDEEEIEEEISELVSCKKGYTGEIYADGGVSDCNDYICNHIYTLECKSNVKPVLDVSPGVADSSGKGVIKIKASSEEGPIKYYYVSEIYKTPTSTNGWQRTNSDTFEIKADPGTKFIWVMDSEGNVSSGISSTVIDTIHSSTTIQSLQVFDSSGNLKAPGKVSYKVDGVTSSNYVRLSNNLMKESMVAANDFNPFDTEYHLEVESPTVTVYATLTSTDSKYVPGYEPRTVNLDYGINTVLIKIEDKEGKVRTYTILVTRKDDRTADNTLNDLTVSVGKINFNSNVTDYKIEIPESTKEVNVDGKLSSDVASVVSEYGFGKVEITGDTTVKLVKIKSQTGSTRTYVLTFIKEGTDEIKKESVQLFSLNIPGVNLPFEKEISNYSFTVGYEQSLIDINAAIKTEGSKSVVYIKRKTDNNYTVTSSKGISLDVGENFIEVKVVDIEGNIAYYRLTIIRKEFGLEVSNDTTLKDLKVLNYDIKFDPNKKEYTVKIKREKTLVITAVPNSNRSEVFIRGNDELTGFSTVRVKVVAENGKFETYSIDIKKDAFNKVIEIGAIIAGAVIIILGSVIIVVKNKNKGKKEYFEE